jgi:anaerobic selenocysteine-containing dehydrogenase
MSSDPGARTATGRCLFCNLGCPLQLELFAPHRWRPQFNGTTTTCARGQMLSDLLQSPHRLYRPRSGNAEVRLDTAIDALARRIADPATARVAIWMDAGLAIEELAAAQRFCAAQPERRHLLIQVPTGELGATEGLDAAGVPQAAPDEGRSPDVFLIVGNPLATHPAAARWLFRPDAPPRRPPAIVVDSSASPLTTYGAPALICRPGAEWAVLAALLHAAGFTASQDMLPANVGESAGVAPAALQQAAERLRDSRQPAALIAPQAGRRDTWRALTAAAASGTHAKDGWTCVLTTHANALGYARYARRQGIGDWWTAALHGRNQPADLLLVVGWDPTSAAPRALWEPMLAAAQHAVLLSAFPPADATAYQAILPLALPAEAGGSFVLADGRVTRVEPVLPPPPGVPTALHILSRLTGQPGPADPTVVEEQLMSTAPEVVPVPTAAPDLPATGGWPAVLIAEPTQYADGQLTRHACWSQQVEPYPELRLAPRDAHTLGVRDGQLVTIHNVQGRARVRIAVAARQPIATACYAEPTTRGDARQPPGWLAVGSAAPAVRRLLGLRFGQADDLAATGVLAVEIETDEAAAQGTRQEASRGHG